MEIAVKQEAPAWARKLNSFNTYFSQDLFGGPKIIKMAWMVNLHKSLSVVVVALLMIWFRNYSSSAWVYLALHGSYGFCWILKHFTFRDSRWEARVTSGGAVTIFFCLATYWIAPYLLISDLPGSGNPPPSGWFLALCIAIYALGLLIMAGSDCQKYYTLKYHKGLIADGMFRYIRHPNYLGEMMIYASFALLVRHWIPWMVLAFWWIIVFLTNMMIIESSLSRYLQWDAYKSRTGLLLPLGFFKMKRIINT